MKHGKFVLPKGHKPFMKVAKGGSNCGNCKFLTSDKKHCSNSHFVTWYGTSLLPTPVNRYCSDFYEPNPEYMASGGYVPSPLVGIVVPPMNPERFEKKRAHLETLANSIRSLRMNVTKDLKSDDEKTRLTALAVAMIDKTAERVGNEDSAEKGHFGITVLRKRHVTISGNTVQLNYKGKSGVIHEKSFSDELVASSLKNAIKTSPKRSIFVTSDGFRIKADRVNRYLSDYNISAKDLRGYHANKYIVDKLSKQDIPSDVKGRKVLFRKAVRYSAARVGHKPMTLQKHYLMPELETYYIYEGEIINLSDFYSKGGSITSGEIKGPSHKQGGVPMVVAPTFVPIEVEGKEYYLCKSALSDPTVHSFVDKTNKEILDSIFVSHGCKYDKVIANSQDFIICKLATQDKSKRTVSGTVSELINSMQSEYGCRVTSDSGMYLFGGEIGLKKAGSGYAFIDQNSNINFEIDDSNCNVIVDKLPAPDGSFVRLSTIFDHKELYKIYPFLKDVKVKFVPKSKSTEKNNPNEIIFLGDYSANKPKDPLFYNIIIATDHDFRPIKSTVSPSSGNEIILLRDGIIAELQHFIQVFEWGKTEIGWKGHYDRIQRDLQGIRDQADQLDRSDPRRIALEKRYDWMIANQDALVDESYRSDYYEIHSRASVNRIDLTAEERRITPPIELFLKNEDDSPSTMKHGGEVDCGCSHSYMELGGEISDSEKEKAKELLNSLTEEQLSLIASQYKEIVGEFIISQEKELDALVAERESLVSKKKEQDALKQYDHAMVFAAQIPSIDLKIRNKKNIILASKNGGDIISFTDKKDVLHSDIPNFSKINSSFISFDEETILTDPLPVYIPIIDEEIFASKGYIFDAIRVGSDIYILAVNGYREFKRSRSYREESKPVPAEDFEQGYVTVTLDQLALISDYYYTKAKAVEYKRANESNKRVEATYDALPLERKLGYYNQRNFYNGLPASVKKKVSLVEWEAFTLEQKESYYKPIQRRQGRRLVSKLEENEMWTSFHEMYERFINPLALPHDKKGVSIQPGSSRFGIYGNPEVFAYWRAFRYMMNWKIKDLKVQRQFESDLRAIAIETSFGESNTDPILREKYGILVKRQNGDKINPAEIEQIRIAWSNVNKLFGGLVKSALDSNLKISHTGTKLVFSSKAAGMYIPKMGTIAVSNKFGDAQFESILAHETAHWIDNILGIASGKRWYSDDFENSAGIIADTLRRNMNEASDSDYINSTKECFARAMEQYFAIETFGMDASIIYSYIELDRKRPYFAESHYVSESVYNEKLRPLIIKFITENKTFFKYNIMVEESNDFAQFIEIIKTSKDFNDAFTKTRNIKNVPPEVADLFWKKYNPTGNLSMDQAYRNFYNEFKTPDMETQTNKEVVIIETVAEQPTGAEIMPHKEVMANQGVAITEVLTINRFHDLKEMEAGMLYNLRNKNVNEEVGDAKGLKEVVYKKLVDKYYIDEDWENGYTLTDKAMDFINTVDARLETRKSVKSGSDLFPETSNIPELSDYRLSFKEYLSKHNVRGSKSGLAKKQWVKAIKKANDEGLYEIAVMDGSMSAITIQDMLNEAEVPVSKDIVRLVKEEHEELKSEHRSAMKKSKADIEAVRASIPEISAKPITVVYTKADLINTIEGLKVLAEDKKGREKSDLEATIAGLEILLEDMPEKMERGGYALYKDGSVINEYY